MLSFIATTILLLITPGPGVLSTAGIGASYGIKPGLRYVTGLFIGSNAVLIAVASGLAGLILVNPVIRTILFSASALYLLYLAARIALAGTEIKFIQAQGEPGVLEGLLLQPINPKAYVVTTTLFSGFAFMPDAYWTEVIIKAVIFNGLWIPVHVIWLYAGAALQQLDLPPQTQRAINFAMAAAMVGVVALAALSG
ncbi:MAG: LysE family translocator [Pseudomonadota bacterium]